jgi:hypothetical protein
MTEFECLSVFGFPDGDTERSKAITREQHAKQADGIELSGFAVEIKLGISACGDGEVFVEFFVDGQIVCSELAEVGDQVVGFAVFVFVVGVGDFGEHFNADACFEAERHFFEEGFDRDEDLADVNAFTTGHLGDQGGDIADFEFGGKGERKAIFAGVALGLEFGLSAAKGFENDAAWDREFLTKDIDFKAFTKQRVEVQAKDIRGDREAGETNSDVVRRPIVFGNAHDSAIHIKVDFAFDAASFGVVGFFDELDKQIIFVHAKGREERIVFVEDVDGGRKGSRNQRWLRLVHRRWLLRYRP